MTPLKWLMTIFGVALIAMGVEAYLAKNSVPSLLGGGIAGVLMLVCVWLTTKYPRVAYIAAAVVCLGMLGRFLPAFLKDTSNIYPALVISISSVVVFVALISGHVLARRRTG